MEATADEKARGGVFHNASARTQAGTPPSLAPPPLRLPPAAGNEGCVAAEDQGVGGGKKSQMRGSFLLRTLFANYCTFFYRK